MLTNQREGMATWTGLESVRRLSGSNQCRKIFNKINKLKKYTGRWIDTKGCLSSKMSTNVREALRRVSIYALLWQAFLCLIGIWYTVQQVMQAQTVYVDSNTSVSDAQFVTWSASARTGMAVTYGGLTTLDCVPGAIVIRKAKPGEWTYPAGVKGATGACGNGGYRVMYPDTITLQVALHETMHALNNYGSGSDAFCAPHICQNNALMSVSNPWMVVRRWDNYKIRAALF